MRRERFCLRFFDLFAGLEGKRAGSFAKYGHRLWEGRDGIGFVGIILSSKLAVKFRIRGNLRFLSHQETMRVLQRAMVRAGMDISYSQGYNPHPQLSLPLPRSVGVESDDELMCVCIKDGVTGSEQSDKVSEDLRVRLERQLPEGCEVISVELVGRDKNYYPVSARYVFRLREDTLQEQVRAAAAEVLKSEKLPVERRINEAGNMRTVDVRGFIRSVDISGLDVAVTAAILPVGTIRVDEIMQLLAMDESMLAVPVRRECVEWRGCVS